MNLTVRDVSTLFSISEKTVYRWIKKDGFPYYRVNGQYRFSRAALLEWAASRHVAIAPDMIRSDGDDKAVSFSLCQALENGGIYYRVEGSTTDAVIRAVSEYVPLPEGSDREVFYQFLLAREKLSSTALGDGIAVPHVRNPVVLHMEKPVLVLCFLEQPVDFHAPDGKPVNTVFLLACPTIRCHLQLLSRLVFLLREPSLRRLLEEAASRETLLQAFASLEDGIKSR